MQIVKGLTQSVMYNENRYFAGVRDNTIYVTASGKTIASVPANNPIIISTEADYNLFYLENDGRSNYEIKMLESKEGNLVSNPRLVKSMKGPRGSAIITAAVKDATNIYFGGKNGAVYQTEAEATINTTNLTVLQKILIQKSMTWLLLNLIFTSSQLMQFSDHLMIQV